MQGALMEQQIIWIIALLGFGTLVGVFWKMKGGFGPLNLRVVGIVLIAIFTSLLALAKSSDLSAALGILGAIAGYLFGAKAEHAKPVRPQSGDATINNSGSIGDNTKIALGDINETVNNIKSQIKDLRSFLGDEKQKLNHVFSPVPDLHEAQYEYLINTIFERNADVVYEAMATVIKAWSDDGWSLLSMTENYDRSDALILIFRRPTDDSVSVGTVTLYNGSRMARM